ncbi:STAS domain-containing protein [Catellatospora sichuanensis]|uniref:STAS domain-containing protein n=1 Tax=Catellatospora sichuanensis TaxID=1969805 RepID=UPI0011828279|nr:STAS domain-containing protein [Catellatospora sichuanensis]
MTSQLSHHVECDGTVVRIGLTGEIDLAVVDELRELLVSAGCRRPGLAVAVDMCAVTFIDSSGIRTLVVARDEVVASGSELRLTNLSGMALRVLQVSGVYGHLCDEPAE